MKHIYILYALTLHESAEIIAASTDELKLHELMKDMKHRHAAMFCPIDIDTYEIRRVDVI